MKLFLIRATWDFYGLDFHVFAKTERSAVNKFKKLKPYYDIRSITEIKYMK